MPNAYKQRALSAWVVAGGLALLGGTCGQAAVTGQWDFTNGDLAATVGDAMNYYDGPGGATQQGTVFATATIGGQPAKVMQFPACDSTSFMGYLMGTPAEANGDGFEVNQWTLILDLMYPTASDLKWRAIFEADARATPDSDFFVNTSNGIGISGSYQGSVTPDTWHRIAIVVDQSAGVNQIRKYINGVKVGTQTAGGVDGRWGLPPFSTVELFNDNDGDVAPGSVNSVQLRNEALTDGQILALGGATAAGIPQTIPSIPAFVESRSPDANVANAAALPLLKVVLNGGSTTVDPASIKLRFDGAEVPATVVPPTTGNSYAATYQVTTLLAAGSTHTVGFAWTDSGAGLQSSEWSFKVASYQTLSEAYARPLGSANTRGMLFRSTLAPLGTPELPNTLARARSQLDGTYPDPLNPGTPLGNDATPGPINGYYAVDVVNFDQLAASVANFPDDQGFPGLPVADVNSASTETLAYIEMQPGYYRMGVNSDDGFEITVGTPPYSPVASVSLGAFDGGRGLADSLFDFVVTKAGVYAFRLVYFEGGGDARLEWFTENTSTGERILVNDPAKPGSLVAYRVQTGVTAGPYVRSAVPAPGDTGAKPDTAITIEIVDGATVLVPGSVVLKINDVAAAPLTLNKVGNVTTVQHKPGVPFAYNTTYNLALTFGDGTTTQTVTWAFTTRKAEQFPSITGQWDFDAATLAATIGEPLQYMSDAAQSATAFGSTADYGLPKIGGQDARVLRFAGATANNIGYIVKHGAVPNGGGNKVNQWTFIVDILVPYTGTQYLSFLQVDNLQNANDGDFFLNYDTPGDPDGDGIREGGIGIGGAYASNETPPPYLKGGQWHRVVLAVDHSATEKTLPDGSTTTEAVMNKYVDGQFFSTQLRGANQVDLRHTLFDTFLLFADEDGESMLAYVNSVQMRNYTMSRAEVAALGVPSAAGIPTVSGQWDFEAGNLTATLGSALAYVGDTAGTTTFSSATIGGQPANVMGFPAASKTQGFAVYHGGLPNGGGEFVNNYSLIMDILFPTASDKKWRNLWQTSTNNANDGDMFVNSGNGIGISSQYQGTIAPETWNRVAFAFDLTASTVGKYINGTLVNRQTLSAGVDGRWSLLPYALLFTDEDGETAAGFVNSIQFRPVTLSDAQVAALGSATAAGIPLDLPFIEPPQDPPTITVTRNGGSLVLTWDAKYTGFTLGENDVVTGGTWTTVQGVTGNSATIPIGTGNKYFRLSK